MTRVGSGVVYVYNCESHVSCSSQKTLLHRGYWKLECWGASGGNASKSIYDPRVFVGGRGGYSVGVIHVKDPYEIFYLNIGGQGLNLQEGKNKRIEGGFNGGGSSWIGSFEHPIGSGGGGTDIRRGGDDTSQRILVAGGGGAAGAENSESYDSQYGGYGGGEIGGSGGGRGNIPGNDVASGGNHDSGGEKGVANDGQYGEDGKKFYGGMGTITNNTESSGGGGGGWFGGGGSASAGGGGGSGYVGGVISYGYVKKETIGGNLEFPSPFGGYEIGHIGDGAIRITSLNIQCSCVRTLSLLHVLHLLGITFGLSE